MTRGASLRQRGSAALAWVAPGRLLGSRFPQAAGLLSDTAPVALAGISAAGLGTVWWFLAFRAASPLVVGAFVAAVGVGNLLGGVAELGAGNAVIRYGATWPSLRGAMIQTAVVLVGSVAVALPISIAVVLPSVLVGPTAMGILPTTAVVLLLALGTSTYGLTDSIMLALGQRRRIFARAITSSFARVALLLVLAAGSRPSFATLGVAYGVPLLLSSVAILALAYRSQNARPFLLPLEHIRLMAPYAAQSYLFNLLGSSLPNILAPLVAVLLGLIAAAQFGVLWLVASLMLLFPAALSQTTFSTLSRGERTGRLLRPSIKLLITLELPIMLGLTILLPLGAPILGPVYAEVSPRDLLLFMAGVLCVGIANQIFAQARVIPGGMRLIGLALGVQTVSVLGLTLALAPAWGIGGIAVAWLIGSSLALGVSLWGWWLLTHRGSVR